jgi:hypothetical protein
VVLRLEDKRLDIMAPRRCMILLSRHGAWPPQQDAAPLSPARSAWIGGHGTEP